MAGTQDRSEPQEGVAALNQELSQELGYQVYSRDAQWLRYAERGVVVKVRISRERFKQQLTPDLVGMTPRDDKERKQLEQALTFGYRYLLPADYAKRFDTLDSRARYRVEKWGYTTFWGVWIPVTAFPSWLEDHREVERQYQELIDEIEAKYDELKEETRVAWIGLTNQAWERLKVTGALDGDPGFADKLTWTQAQVKAIMAQVPTIREIRDSLRIRVDATSLPDLSRVEQDRVKAGDIRLTEAERLMMEALNKTAAERAGKGVDQFLTEVRTQLSGQVFKVAASALQVMQGRGGRIDRNSSDALRKMIEVVRVTDFWGETDGALQARLAELDRLMGTRPEKRSYQELGELLTTMGAEARLLLMEMDAPMTREALDLAAGVGLPDDAEGLAVLARRGQTPSPTELFADDDGEVAVRQMAEGDDDDFADFDADAVLLRGPIAGAA